MAPSIKFHNVYYLCNNIGWSHEDKLKDMGDKISADIKEVRPCSMYDRYYEGSLTFSQACG